MCKARIPIPEPADETALADKSVKDRIVTLDELRGHNVPRDAWCSVDGRVVDITDFAKRHPGGDIILLAAGKDATVLLKTYHPRGVPSSLLDKLQVGTMKDGAIPKSFYSWDSDFYNTLQRRVIQRLNELNLARRGGYEIWIKAIFILCGFWYSLYNMYVQRTFWVATLWSMSMGVFAAFVGTCIQHDGNHGAFANSRALNKVAGWTLDMIGASGFTWEIQHMLGHHPYTNVLDVDEEDRKVSGVDSPMAEKDQESDPDVFSSFPAMRMHPYHQPEWYHKYQHLYAPILFAMMTLAKVLQQDVEVATSKRLYHIDANCRYGSVLNVLRFWTMKVLTCGYMIGLPCYFHGISKGLGLFIIGHFICGELLATMFIVNHVIEGISFGKKGDRLKDEDGNAVFRPTTVSGVTPMEQTRSDAAKKSKGGKISFVPYNDWAAVQCQTSVNWSSGSWFWNHFSGGLSHQIEHHLFPSICHTNYVYIHDVVQSTCEEYGVPYQNEASLFVAYGKMLRHLKFLGSEKKIL